MGEPELATSTMVQPQQNLRSTSSTVADEVHLDDGARRSPQSVDTPPERTAFAHELPPPVVPWVPNEFSSTAPAAGTVDEPPSAALTSNTGSTMQAAGSDQRFMPSAVVDAREQKGASAIGPSSVGRVTSDRMETQAGRGVRPFIPAAIITQLQAQLVALEQTRHRPLDREEVVQLIKANSPVPFSKKTLARYARRVTATLATPVTRAIGSPVRITQAAIVKLQAGVLNQARTTGTPPAKAIVLQGISQANRGRSELGLNSQNKYLHAIMDPLAFGLEASRRKATLEKIASCAQRGTPEHDLFKHLRPVHGSLQNFAFLRTLFLASRDYFHDRANGRLPPDEMGRPEDWVSHVLDRYVKDEHQKKGLRFILENSTGAKPFGSNDDAALDALADSPTALRTATTPPPSSEPLQTTADAELSVRARLLPYQGLGEALDELKQATVDGDVQQVIALLNHLSTPGTEPSALRQRAQELGPELILRGLTASSGAVMALARAWLGWIDGQLPPVRLANQLLDAAASPDGPVEEALRAISTSGEVMHEFRREAHALLQEIQYGRALKFADLHLLAVRLSNDGGIPFPDGCAYQNAADSLAAALSASPRERSSVDEALAALQQDPVVPDTFRREAEALRTHLLESRATTTESARDFERAEEFLARMWQNAQGYE